MTEQAQPPSPTMMLQVDIVSDVVCPWCIIGYLRFQQALTRLPGEFDVTLRWQPFELNPQMPPEGQDLQQHIMQKYGVSAEQSQAARTQLTELGADLGFAFDYFDGMRAVNTFQAHQLLHWAEEQGKQNALKLALFEAFFSRREDVSDEAVLLAVADRVGLSSTEAAEVLTDGRYADVVRAQQQFWIEREVQGVPAFVFNHQYMVSGAQDAETFVMLLQKIKASAEE